jgi:selenocysteine lyase/cysteine desulfurase
VTIRPEEVRAKLEAGRTAIAERLHLLADEIEALPLEGATEALSWFGDQIERLLREADRILGADFGHHRP